MKTVKRGFTIMEMLIAVAVVSVGVLGIYSALHPMLVSSRAVSLRLTAAYLVQEGVEVVYNIRDTNVRNRQKWSGSLLGCQLGCQGDYTAGTSPLSALQSYNPNEFLKLGDNGLYGYGEGRQTPFTRQITIDTVSADILKVTVTVTFENSGAQSQFEAEVYLYNYE